MTPAVVVVACNRAQALSELLESAARARYPEGVRVPLVISIDKAAGSERVAQVAQAFSWAHGEKRVIVHPENLGLRAHVLRCGGLTREFGAIIMLEDDLLVSPGYYRYAAQALDFYEDHPRVAQIALYAPRYNELAMQRPFVPLDAGCDAYFMQLPCSWGQAWTRRMWQDFEDWNAAPPPDERFQGRAPAKLLGWKATSWKKRFALYMVDRDLLAVYPYAALSTNMGHAGTHHAESAALFQVALSRGREQWQFMAPEDERAAVYDIFMESVRAARALGAGIDYYGIKAPGREGLWLSTRALGYELRARYALKLVPPELNALHALPGEGLYLYDLGKTAPPPRVPRAALFRYEFPNLSRPMLAKALRVGSDVMIAGLRAKLKRSSQK